MVVLDKRSLIVVAGKMGVGKTTLIQAAFPDAAHVDVYPFVHAHGRGHAIPEDKTILGYRDMYHYVAGLTAPSVTVELGTNHPELNARNVRELAARYMLQVFFCTASEATCRARLAIRGRPYDSDDARAIDVRMRKNFPHEYQIAFEKQGIAYTLLDMEKPIEENVERTLEKVRYRLFVNREHTF